MAFSPVTKHVRSGVVTAALVGLLTAGLVVPPAHAADLPAPLLRYSFDSLSGSVSAGTTVPDDNTTTPHAGSIVGTGAAAAAGPTGLSTDRALTLPGGASTSTAAYVSIAPALVDAGMTDITLTQWVKWNGAAQCVWPMSLGASNTQYLFATPQCGTSFVGAVKKGSVEVRAAGGSPLSSTGWAHVAVVLKGGTSITSYVNGVQVGQNPTTYTAGQILGGTTFSGYLGKSFYSADAYFGGAVDDFRVYGSALTSAQVGTVGADGFVGIATADAAALSLGDTSAVTTNLTLPTRGAQGSTISWSSSNPVAVTASGVVTRPADGEGDAQATLTPTVTFGGTAVTGQPIAVTVSALTPAENIERVEAATAALTIPHADDIRGNILLPTTSTRAQGGSASAGVDISWQSSNPDLIRTDGWVTRPAVGAVDGHATLTATLTRGSVTRTKSFETTVVARTEFEDPFGYLMVHFVETSETDVRETSSPTKAWGEQVYFSLSDGDNPLVWNRLNDGSPSLTVDTSLTGDTGATGTGGIRDPYILRSPDGDRFYIVATDLRIMEGATTNWDTLQRKGSKSLVIWEADTIEDATDPAAWSEPRLVQVSPDTAGMTWAPEVTYDDEAGEYVVYWASTLYPADDAQHTSTMEGSKIVYATTRDFVTFSEPAVMLDQGAGQGAIIDTTVIKEGGDFYRFHKDNGSRGLALFQDKASSITAPFSLDSILATSIGKAHYGAVEAPLIFKDHHSEKWYLFVDVYGTTPQGYRAYVTDDLDTGNWSVAAGSSIPANTKHGAVIHLYGGEWEAIAGVSTSSIAAVQVTTATGFAPALPGTVTVSLTKQGAAAGTQSRPVVWDEPAAGAFDSPGTVTIGGTVSGTEVRASAIVSVGAGTPATGVTVTAPSSVIARGEKARLKATVAPAEVGSQAVVWTTSDARIATVSSSGQVTAHARGTVTIDAASALTPSVKGSVQLEVVRPEADLRLRYDFERDVASTITDVSGHGFDGSLKNSANYVDRDGGGALQLSGGAVGSSTAPYVTIPNGVLKGAKSATVSTWVKWSGGANYQWIYGLGDDTAKYIFASPSIGATGKSALTTAGAGGENSVLPATLGTSWTHLVTTINGSTGTITGYVNGQSIGSTATKNRPEQFYDAFQDFSGYIGKSFYNDPYFAGAVDDFSIFGTALTAEQVATLYSEGTVDPAPPAPVITRLELAEQSEVVGGWATVDSPVLSISTEGETTEFAARVDDGGRFELVDGILPEIEDGTHEVTVVALNGEDSESEPATLTVKVDTTAPVSTAEFSSRERTVAIVAEDAASGVALVQYSTDGGAQWQEYTGPFSVGSAAAELTYRATDVAGHIESENSLTIPAKPVDPVIAAPTSVTASLTKPARYGSAASLAVKVTGASSGTVTVKEGSRTLAKAALKSGRATLVLPKTLKPGRHALTVTFAGDATHEASSRAITVTVAKASASLKATVTGTARKPSATIVVKPSPKVSVSGRVVVKLYRGTTLLRTRSVVVPSSGSVKVAFPAVTKGKRYTVVATYGGSSTVKAAGPAKGSRTLR